MKANLRFEIDIETSDEDSLLVLADALTGELEAAIKAHGPKILASNTRVDGKSIYEKDGSLVWVL